ncbi:unnamed protein product [Brassicogethes aeneus]|uniref:Nuclear receptor-binding factor 2 MIT domain-containing protein n=1 Tax=Brassicogethes aeneus TaxID=1431903 RepID=A0A9P0FGB8_BRAAE|nr:unnamed protein product [Brassicogethes aeneus]
MENSTLNRAHQEQRKADALLKQKKFDDCLACHQNAIELLNQTIKGTEHPKALESFNLQVEHHERQIRLITIKKIQYENLKNVDNFKTDVHISNELESQISDESLQVIYATMEQHDSFISYLIKRESGSDNDSCSVSDNDEKVEKGVFTGFKHPKDDATIVEEFKELCKSYRDSIKILLVQLEERNREVKELKYKVRQLEQDKFKAQSKSNNSLKVITDSSGATSPYVFSPSSELSPDVRETNELLQLAPLEMPNFDFTNFTSSLSSTMSQNNNN